MKRLPAKNFTDLIVWQKAHQWVLNVYDMTNAFPKSELFGLTSQLRRAAVSIPANIAEGFKRQHTNDKARFYNISQTSLEECRYYLILTTDLKIGNCEKMIEDLEVISKMLDKYHSQLSSKSETKM